MRTSVLYIDPPSCSELWSLISTTHIHTQSPATNKVLRVRNLCWCPGVSFVTGALWFQLKSRHPAACPSIRWARPPPVAWPLPAAPQTFLLLRQRHPRAWSTLQVSGNASISGHGWIYIFLLTPKWVWCLSAEKTADRQLQRDGEIFVWRASSDSKDAQRSWLNLFLLLQKILLISSAALWAR